MTPMQSRDWFRAVAVAVAAMTPLACGGRVGGAEDDACGTTCELANAQSTCVDATCEVSSCLVGWGDCNQEAGDGCEASFSTDPQSCGDCGVECPSGDNSAAACISGKCTLECATNYADCDEQAANGCESNLSNSSSNCGGCGSACNVGAGESCVEGECVGRPSCQALSDSACRGESCCNSILVAGGTFLMGRSESGTDACLADWACSQYSEFADDLPEFQARVRPYYLDRYEVTVARYRAFLRAYDEWRDAGYPEDGDGGIHQLAGTGWLPDWSSELATTAAAEATTLATDAETDPDQTWTDAPSETELYPIYEINWYMAQAFCIWDGSRLPSEAEWEYAAAGGDENRLYAWGQGAPVCTGDAANAMCGCLGTSAGCTGWQSDLEPVGSRPAGDGRFGHADLQGSVTEWIWDRYATDWYQHVSAPCTDCISLHEQDPNDYAGLRGTWFATAESSTEQFRSASRGYWNRQDHVAGVGFRCARNP